MDRGVVVVIGVGGMGLAIARRQGSGRTVVLADADAGSLRAGAETLRDEGHDVHEHPVDVSSHEAVAALAGAAAARGPVTQIVHTAGLSPAQASAEAIIAVDLIGVAFMLEEFGAVVAAGGAGVVIASMAGHFLAGALSAEDEAALARTPADELADLAVLRSELAADPGIAYGVAKRANHLRVQAASVSWGRRGARINSLSPGIISTRMGQQELASPTGEFMRELTAASAANRLGTPDDIAAAVAFLLGPDSAFVTGTDLLVDGGAVAAQRAGPQKG
jgi:NAD(P)-dependent dehydrogenase (short-subunit alcohol dehydrogenase family)